MLSLKCCTRGTWVQNFQSFHWDNEGNWCATPSLPSHHSLLHPSPPSQSVFGVYIRLQLCLWRLVDEGGRDGTREERMRKEWRRDKQRTREAMRERVRKQRSQEESLQKRFKEHWKLLVAYTHATCRQLWHSAAMKALSKIFFYHLTCVHVDFSDLVPGISVFLYTEKVCSYIVTCKLTFWFINFL